MILGLWKLSPAFVDWFGCRVSPESTWCFSVIISGVSSWRVGRFAASNIMLSWYHVQSLFRNQELTYGWWKKSGKPVDMVIIPLFTRFLYIYIMFYTSEVVIARFLPSTVSFIRRHVFPFSRDMGHSFFLEGWAWWLKSAHKIPHLCSFELIVGFERCNSLRVTVNLWFSGGPKFCVVKLRKDRHMKRMIGLDEGFFWLMWASLQFL